MTAFPASMHSNPRQWVLLPVNGASVPFTRDEWDDVPTGVVLHPRFAAADVLVEMLVSLQQPSNFGCGCLQDGEEFDCGEIAGGHPAIAGDMRLDIGHAGPGKRAVRRDGYRRHAARHP